MKQKFWLSCFDGLSKFKVQIKIKEIIKNKYFFSKKTNSEQTFVFLTFLQDTKTFFALNYLNKEVIQRKQLVELKMRLKYFWVKISDHNLFPDRKAFVLISEKPGVMSNGELESSIRSRCKQGEPSVEVHYLVEPE